VKAPKSAGHRGYKGFAYVVAVCGVVFENPKKSLPVLLYLYASIEGVGVGEGAVGVTVGGVATVTVVRIFKINDHCVTTRLRGPVASHNGPQSGG
jgi:hypothetical protein